MRSVDTVYLAAPAAPGDQSHYSGFVSRHDSVGIWISRREDCRDGGVFFPAHLILRVERDTGWR